MSNHRRHPREEYNMICNKKSKGQFSFLTKGFLMIFLIIALTLVINQVTFYQINMEKITKDYDLSSNAMNLIGMLSNSERCLALNEEVTVGGVVTNKTYTRILDIEKVMDFAQRFADVEPDCARNYLLGYNVTVELIPINISYEFTPESEITVLQRMLEDLEGKSAVFVIDMSTSMEESVGKIKKVDCVKDFLEEFVDNLDSNQRISIIGYGSNGNVNNQGCNDGNQKPAGCILSSPRCGADIIINPTIIGGNENTLKNQINSGIRAEGCTPMAHGLVRGYSMAESNGINDIVVLTDGRENCGGNSVCVVQNHLSSGIRVHSIGFGQRLCQSEDDPNCVYTDTLEEISSITGGRSYIAKDCRELIRLPNRAEAAVEKTEWKFGTTGHSEGKALTGSVTLSLPVIIKRDREHLAGFITVSVYDGDLESVSGLIEYVCKKGVESNVDTFIDLPMKFYNERKELCLVNADDSESCRKVKCDADIVMDDITNPGRYRIVAFWKDGKVNVIV